MRIIVGIDPGITVAIVAIDFKGKLIYSFSAKDMDLKSTIKKISEIGVPSLITCDVSHIPSFVKKIASAFSAKLFYPDHNFSEWKKKKVAGSRYTKKLSFTEEDRIKITSTHQRDAYFAATYALSHYLNKFRKIDAMSIDEEKKDEIKHRVLLGKRIRLDTKKKRIERLDKQKKKRKNEEQIKKIDGTYVKKLEEDNEALKKYVKKLKQELEKEKQKSYNIMLDLEIRKRDKKIARLQTYIFALKKKLKKKN